MRLKFLGHVGQVGHFREKCWNFGESFYGTRHSERISRLYNQRSTNFNNRSGSLLSGVRLVDLVLARSPPICSCHPLIYSTSEQVLGCPEAPSLHCGGGHSGILQQNRSPRHDLGTDSPLRKNEHCQEQVKIHPGSGSGISTAVEGICIPAAAEN